ncbi:MAG TPA: GNAT family N-acetyltransferase [Burkholderiales bacterium]|nr:GNAT family N-acetyltransferase [Burkholderiales bacterium]
MVRIELMPWEQARAEASRIRFAVFVVEQGVPLEIELDEHDAECVHALAFDGAAAVGTGRLLPDGHLGRMAVLREFRGRGVGSAILAKLIEAAAQRGDREVLLSAQVHALDFYRAHGFSAEGEVYQDAGIAHQTMRRAL